MLRGRWCYWTENLFRKTAIFCYSFLCTITNSALPSDLVLDPGSGPAQVQCASQADFPWLLLGENLVKRSNSEDPNSLLSNKCHRKYFQNNCYSTPLICYLPEESSIVMKILLIFILYFWENRLVTFCKTGLFPLPFSHVCKYYCRSTKLTEIHSNTSSLIALYIINLHTAEHILPDGATIKTWREIA